MIADYVGKVHNVDCLEFMRELPDGCVDLVFADPPYWVGFEYDGKLDTEINRWPATSLLEEFKRISRCSLITCGMRSIAEWSALQPDWMCAWFKPGSTRRNGLRGFNTWEPILVFGKPEIAVYQDAIRLPDCANHADISWHPCPKPMKLLSWIIQNFSVDGAVVFDPFMGSGTTAIACEKLGRRWLGCEINPEYCELATRRIKQEQGKVKLFV